jgi:transposase
MIHLPASVRVYLATSPCDMRRSFDGLQALVHSRTRNPAGFLATPSASASMLAE